MMDGIGQHATTPSTATPVATIRAAMASILKVGGHWRAQVRRSGHKSVAQTFETRAEAVKWARKVEADIDGGKPSKAGDMTIAELVRRYRLTREESGRPVPKKSNEDYMLRKLALRFPGETVASLTSERIVRFSQARKKEGAGGYTINMELSKLATVIRHMGSLLDIAFPDAVGKARPLLHHLHLIGPSTKRTRRPTADELAALFEWFAANPRYSLPMEDIIRVAMQAALRRGEVFRIQWADIDVENRLILVRDRKHPRMKAGNHEVVPLVGDSLDIIMRQPRKEGEARIFPFKPGTASTYFLMACRKCGIKDLRLHDLRHEAASALFEAGWNVPEVAVVTGHKDWRNLRRYTNIDPAKIANKGRSNQTPEGK